MYVLPSLIHPVPLIVINFIFLKERKGNLAPSGLQCLENYLAAHAVRAAKQTLPFQGSTP
jgi:hypothetical protein